MGPHRVTDSLGRQWSPGAALGYGTWGWSRLLTDGHGRQAVLKQAYSAADLVGPRDGRVGPVGRGAPPDLVNACRLAADEYADRLTSRPPPLALPLEATVHLDDLQLGLVFPLRESLLVRLQRGEPLSAAIARVHRLADALADAGRVHGNLRPTNVFVDESGQVYLADDVVDATAEHHARLLDLADQSAWLPPEARRSAFAARHWAEGPRPTWDAWALCELLFAAAWSHGPSDGPPAVAEEGLDRGAVSALRQAALDRLEAEGANERFRARAAERLGAMLARGLSIEAGESPPYRFEFVRDVAARAEELLDLVRPRVLEVGRPILPGSAADGTFTTVGTSADVTFGVAVACTHGVTDAADLVCDIELSDPARTDAPALRLEDVRPPAQIQPSGRLRFQITVPQVAAGRHRIRVGFSVRESEDPPVHATGEVVVRSLLPPAPAQVAGSEAPLPRVGPALARERSLPRELGALAAVDDEHTDPSAGPALGTRFPRPLAPPEDEDLSEEAGTISARELGAWPERSDPAMSVPPGPAWGGMPPLTRSLPPAPSPVSALPGRASAPKLMLDPRVHAASLPPGRDPPSLREPPPVLAGTATTIWSKISNEPTLFLGAVVTGCFAVVGMVTVLLKTFG